MAQYQYAVIVKRTKLVPQEELERMDQEQLSMRVAEDLAALVDQVEHTLLTPEMEGWEIISHDLSTYGHAALVTFLLRRAAST